MICVLTSSCLINIKASLKLSIKDRLQDSLDTMNLEAHQIVKTKSLSMSLRNNNIINNNINNK